MREGEGGRVRGATSGNISGNIDYFVSWIFFTLSVIPAPITASFICIPPDVDTRFLG